MIVKNQWQCAGLKKTVVMASLAINSLGVAPSGSEELPQGIITPKVFAPFDSSAPSCESPPHHQRVLTFAQDNRRQFMEGISYGLSLAAKDRQLRYEVRLADNNAAKMFEQVNALASDKIGAVVVAPVDPAILSPVLQRMMLDGTYIGTIVAPPATTLLNAPQYLTGRVLGDAAAAYIRDKLGGTANVVLLTHDSIQYLTPRFVAMRDALASLPGVNIIADISPATVDEQGGFETMNTILLANSRIDVVLGADTVVLGALKALREAKLDRPEQFLGGIDGEPLAVAEIKSLSSPYKTTVSLNSPVFAYAMGQHAADWLEGKSIPKAMDILPSIITAENVEAYEGDLKNPASVYYNSERRDFYLRMYGNTCYTDRDQFVNFPWSSELK
ncbi:sugar ABC transporter substrate-binding protein [Aestuariivirga sp.]|uniref:sugar ABC transporter substrate-binding protein n=1 Tax=Aestuariivirga sp. TaxID=2650926 RepID=UPI0039190FFC